MASIHPAQPVLNIIADTKPLPNGQYMGYIEHRTDSAEGTATESFIAGIFDSDVAARMAAVRLMQTFRSNVVAPGENMV